MGSQQHVISLLQNCGEDLKGSKVENDMNKEMLLALIDQDPSYIWIKICATETGGSIFSCSPIAKSTRLQGTAPNSGNTVALVNPSLSQSKVNRYECEKRDLWRSGRVEC